MKGSQIKNVLIIVLSVALGVLITLFVLNQKQPAPTTQEGTVQQETKEKKNIEKETEVIEVEEKPKEKNNKKAPDRVQAEILTEKELNDAYFIFLNAWNKKDYATQANMIASDFVYQDDKAPQNRASYLENKRKRFGDYNWISVVGTDEKITYKGNTGSVTYYQHYDSPTYESWGYNTFYFRKNNGKVELYKEVFNPIRREKK